MKIYKSSSTFITTPKNFARKNKICSCVCNVTDSSPEKVIEKVTIKYEVEPHKDSYSYIPKLNKNQWSSYVSWGELKKVVELPKIFEKLDDEKDFFIKTAYFLRDNVRMPFIYEIVITNYTKYEMIKVREQRKNKLLKIKNI